MLMIISTRLEEEQDNSGQQNERTLSLTTFGTQLQLP